MKNVCSTECYHCQPINPLTSQPSHETQKKEHPTLSHYLKAKKKNATMLSPIKSKPQFVIHCFRLNSKIENYTFCDFDNATMWYMAAVQH